MRKIFLIGIGTGNPDHMTLEGIKALAKVDRVFVPTKGQEKALLATIRRTIVEQHAPTAKVIEFALPVRDAANPDYGAGVSDWHAAIAAQYAGMIEDMAEDESAALLVWGDPGLYDSTLRILELARLRGTVFGPRVIAGITAVAALTAAFAIPFNTIGNPVLITTGRKLAQGWPSDTDTVVVMLDGRKTYAEIDAHHTTIYWAAYVGMEQEILIHGPLARVRDMIGAARDAARAEHGWIMDIYLLRRDFGSPELGDDGS